MLTVKGLHDMAFCRTSHSQSCFRDMPICHWTYLYIRLSVYLLIKVIAVLIPNFPSVDGTERIKLAVHLSNILNCLNQVAALTFEQFRNFIVVAPSFYLHP